jgi:hypothetical protein
MRDWARAESERVVEAGIGEPLVVFGGGSYASAIAGCRLSVCLHAEDAALLAGDDPESDNSLATQPVVELEDAAGGQRAAGAEEAQHKPILGR